MVGAPLRVGHGMFDDSLFCLLTISSYLGSVVSDCRGTMCATCSRSFELVKQLRKRFGCRQGGAGEADRAFPSAGLTRYDALS